MEEATVADQLRVTVHGTNWFTELEAGHQTDTAVETLWTRNFLLLMKR